MNSRQEASASGATARSDAIRRTVREIATIVLSLRASSSSQRELLLWEAAGARGRAARAELVSNRWEATQVAPGPEEWARLIRPPDIRPWDSKCAWSARRSI